MRKIKVLLGTAALVSLLGFSSFAAITTTPKGVQKLDSADLVDALNNNADILDNHVDKIAGTDILGHVKIGTGLEVTEDGTASVKIANDLETDDSETALSAAMGVELNKNIEAINNSITYKFEVINVSGTTDEFGQIKYELGDKIPFMVINNIGISIAAHDTGTIKFFNVSSNPVLLAGKTINVNILCVVPN